jgi:hypothetical protein
LIDIFMKMKRDEKFKSFFDDVFLDFFHFYSQLYLSSRVLDLCHFQLFFNPSLWWDLRNAFSPIFICLCRFGEVLLPRKRSKKKLHLIHIGKCAGTSIRKKILASEKASCYSKVIVTHVVRPIYSSRDDHVLLLRGPISRSLSAFNWRYYLVVEQGKQSNRFRGEKNILLKYQNLNNLAESLYFKDGRPNRKACSEYNSIHHLRESISYYLNSHFFDLDPFQLLGVICQNDLKACCEDVLGVSEIPQINSHGSKLSVSIENSLSKIAQANLRRFLKSDYAAIAKLYAMGYLSSKNFEILMQN